MCAFWRELADAYPDAPVLLSTRPVDAWWKSADATIFATQEPCAMCVGALLESDVEALVFAVANTRDGAAGTIIQLAQHPALPRRIKVVSGIRRDEAEALFAPLPAG